MAYRQVLRAMWADGPATVGFLPSRRSPAPASGSQGAGLFAKLDAGDKLAAQNVSVFTPDVADGAAVAGNLVSR
ncbi:hypothetical protein FJP65_12130 [Stenotrophomonas maltophilia]|jgi:hypothetical protein|nr:hypothetical protein FJP65_12130 [Stenotrophomonas maltophilia]